MDEKSQAAEPVEGTPCARCGQGFPFHAPGCPNTPAVAENIRVTEQTLEEPARRLWRLKLDHDRVYWGAEEIAPDALKEGDVTLDHRPDNPAGAYRWEGDAFVALERSKRKAQPDAPLADRALYEMLWQMQMSGATVPEYSKDWACWYETTQDADFGDLFKRRFARALGRLPGGQ